MIIETNIQFSFSFLNLFATCAGAVCGSDKAVPMSLARG